MLKTKNRKRTQSKKWMIYLEIKLQYASCEWRIDKSKCHKGGTNEKIKGKQTIKKGTSLVFGTWNASTQTKSIDLEELLNEQARFGWFIYR